MNWLATSLTRLNLSAAYIDAKFDEYPGAPCYPTQTAAQGCVATTDNAGNINLVQDASGKPMPNSPKFKVDSLRLAEGMDIGRFERRNSLLNEFDQQRREISELADCRKLSNEQQLAMSLLTSSRLGHAFELDRETPATRDRYGRHAFGQSLLLARRLVQAGVPLNTTRDLLGHGSLTMTLRYAHLAPDNRRKAVEKLVQS